MASLLPRQAPTRPLCSTCLLSSRPSPAKTAAGASSSPSPFSATQLRHATLVPRPRRPYHFTQLVQLSDGSTYTVRTTSPAALHRSTKDTRNHVLWQPSDRSLRNVEVDEAGKLAAFRERFGRGWDAAESPAAAAAAEEDGGRKKAGGKKDAAAAAAEAKAAAEEEGEQSGGDPFDSLADLISGYAAQNETTVAGGLSAKDQARKDKAGRKKK